MPVIRPDSATVTIADNPALIAVTAISPAAHEEGLVLATVRVSRSGGNVNAPLIVALSTSGSATCGVDYAALPTSVTFSPGQSYIDLAVTPLADAIDEPVETVILSVTNVGTAYLAAPGQQQAQATLDDPPRVVIDSLQPAAIDEGGTVSLTGRVWNPDGTPVTLQIRWRDQWMNQVTVTPAANGTPFHVNHQYLDDPTNPNDTYTVEAKVIDAANNEQTDTTDAVVHNVAPTWRNPDPLLLGASCLPWTPPNNGPLATHTVTLYGYFQDPGDEDSFVATIDWGDGNGTQAVNIPAGLRTFSPQHTYAYNENKDKYVITVDLQDDDGGAAQQLQIELDNNRPPVIDLSLQTAGAQDLWTFRMGPDRFVSSDPDTSFVTYVTSTDRDNQDVPDADPPTYAIVGGTGVGKFALDAKSGKLALIGPVASGETYDLTIRVTDTCGAYDEGVLTIEIVSVIVGVKGDTIAVEDGVNTNSPDDIVLTFERIESGPNAYAAPLVVHFYVRYGASITAYGDLKLEDFDATSQAVLQQLSVTIDANQTTKTITLEAIHDEDLQVEEARLWIREDAAYGIVRDDLASNVPGGAPGTFLHPMAPLNVISGVALFGEYTSHNPDVKDPALVDVNDVNQGNLGDCYLWTAVVALITNVPGYIEQLIHVDASAPPGVYRYFVDLKNADGSLNQRTVTLDLARGLDSADLSGDTDAAGLAEVWTLVLEQAYAQVLPNGYADLDDGGTVAHAWTALTGKSAVILDVSTWTDEQIAARIAQEYAGNKIMAVGTPQTGGKKEQDVLPDDVRGHHAYFVEGVLVEDGSAKSLGLKNPWGHSHTTLFRDHYSEAISTLYVLERP